MQAVETVTVTLPLDPYLGLAALAAYSGLSVRTLRAWLRHPLHPLPHYRVGALDRRAGRRGAKIVVRRSDYDTWAARWRVQQAAPSRDLGAIMAAAVASVKDRRGAPKIHGKRRGRGKPPKTTGPRAMAGGAGCSWVAD